MAERATRNSAWSFAEFVLANLAVAEKGHMACIDTASGEVTPGDESTTLIPVGYFEENVTGNGTRLVRVRLFEEKRLHWWGNDEAPNAVVAADLGQLCFIKDSTTVSSSSAGNTRSAAGIVWGVNTVHGVLVEMSTPPAAVPTSIGGLELVETALPAFSSNNINVPASPPSGGIYDVPTTGAASTITLPATAVEGTLLVFVADGTKNGHTVQYRDATGPDLTAALTASKRHMVTASYLNGAWYAQSTVSP